MKMLQLLGLDSVLLILVSVGILIRYIPQICFDIANKRKRVLNRKNPSAKAIHIFLIYTVIYGCFLLNLGSYSNMKIVIISGISVLMLGFLIGMIGLFTLNYQYSEELICFEGSDLITHGIYKVIRHPMRVGLFMELFGIVLLSNTLLLISPLLVVLILQSIRTNVEEQMLKENFGVNAIEYFSKVPKYNIFLGILKLSLSKILDRQPEII